MPGLDTDEISPARLELGSARPVRGPDAASRAWIADLHAEGAVREAAVARLGELLLGAARFEVRRRAAHTPSLRGEELDDIARQTAADATMAVLGKLDDYRGASRFSTWAYKFALLEASVAMRRRAWQGREVVLRAADWDGIAAATRSVEEVGETRELLEAIVRAVATELTEHQRQVLLALAVDGVPIDVLAERLTTTRGALYKALHDARRKLRAKLAADGLDPSPEAP